MPGRLKAASEAADFLKCLHGRQLTRTQICADLDWPLKRTERWLAEFRAQGIVLHTESDEPAPGKTKGRRPFLFRLSERWSGAAK